MRGLLSSYVGHCMDPDFTFPQLRRTLYTLCADWSESRLLYIYIHSYISLCTNVWFLCVFSVSTVGGGDECALSGRLYGPAASVPSDWQRSIAYGGTYHTKGFRTSRAEEESRIERRKKGHTQYAYTERRKIEPHRREGAKEGRREERHRDTIEGQRRLTENPTNKEPG